jgi:hypothetical protein
MLAAIVEEFSIWSDGEPSIFSYRTVVNIFAVADHRADDGLNIKHPTMNTQPLFVLTKFRTCSFHALPEIRAMVMMDQMAKFMDDNVVHDPSWCDYNFPVEFNLAFG